MKILSLLFIFLAAGCGTGNDESAYVKEASILVSDDFEDLKEVPSTHQSMQKTAPEIQQKIIKTGNLTYRVEKIRNEYDLIKKLLSKYDSYLANENQNKGYDRINYNLSVKVPPKHFDSLIAELSHGKRVDNKWISSDNVTDRYYDLQARINNKKKLEERYQAILAKAKNVRDILEIERSLNQVRSEIESLQGQFKLLNHRISYSTLDISFYEILPYEVREGHELDFLTKVSNAISSGWQGFLSFMVFAVRLWPFIILAFFAVMLFKKIRARKK